VCTPPVYSIYFFIKIVKCGGVVADGCKIIVGFGEMLNDKIKTLNFGIKILNY